MKKIVYFSLRGLSLVLAAPSLVIGLPAFMVMLVADYIEDPYNMPEDVKEN